MFVTIMAMFLLGAVYDAEEEIEGRALVHEAIVRDLQHLYRDDEDDGRPQRHWLAPESFPSVPSSGV